MTALQKRQVVHFVRWLFTPLSGEPLPNNGDVVKVLVWAYLSAALGVLIGLITRGFIQ
jgi:hypothetical protein